MAGGGIRVLRVFQDPPGGTGTPRHSSITMRRWWTSRRTNNAWMLLWLLNGTYVITGLQIWLHQTTIHGRTASQSCSEMDQRWTCAPTARMSPCKSPVCLCPASHLTFMCDFLLSVFLSEHGSLLCWRPRGVQWVIHVLRHSWSLSASLLFPPPFCSCRCSGMTPMMTPTRPFPSTLPIWSM